MRLPGSRGWDIGRDTSNQIYSTPRPRRGWHRAASGTLEFAGAIGQAGTMHPDGSASSPETDSDAGLPPTSTAPARPGRRRAYTRDEPVAKQLDRNYGELLQELRVAQTGVQILFAFLLTIPFQAGFAKLSDFQADLYLATLISAAMAVVLLIAPVATHRLLFRRRQKDELVIVTARLAAGGLTFLSLAILGAVLLVVDLVAGAVAAALVVTGLGLMIALFWLAFPASLRRRVEIGEPETDREPPSAQR
jgi:hypothetical protein